MIRGLVRVVIGWVRGAVDAQSALAPLGGPQGVVLPCRGDAQYLGIRAFDDTWGLGLPHGLWSRNQRVVRHEVHGPKNARGSASLRAAC
jgi:hypothetical protein